MEFDHADIYDDLAAIQRQFHHLMRILPSNGLALVPFDDANVQTVLDQGCWSDIQQIGLEWQCKNASADGSEFDVYHDGKLCARLSWQLIGQHNVNNALMAIAAEVVTVVMR